MILRGDSLSEFMRRIARDVDFPSEARLCLPKRRRDFSQADGTDDEQVHVAQRMFAAASNRTVNKCTVDPSSERFQGLSEGWQQTGGFLEETVEFGEQRRSRFGLEVDPGSFTTLFQDAAVHERLEFPLQARRSRSDELGQFGEVPPLVRLRERRRKNLSPNRGESAPKAAVLRIMRTLLRTTRKTNRSGRCALST